MMIPAMFVLLGVLWARPSQAMLNVVGYPGPYLPALEGFVVTEGQLDWEGTEVEGDLREQARRFWWFAELWQRTFGEEVTAFQLTEPLPPKQSMPWRVVLHVQEIDRLSQSMKCTSAIAVSPRAAHVLAGLGCIWAQS